MNTRQGLTFKITVPHNPDESFHRWWFPNGWRGVGPTERRDRGGRLAGKRDGHFPEWFVLGCNNTKCPGRAVVPVSVLTNYADAQDDWVSA